MQALQRLAQALSLGSQTRDICLQLGVTIFQVAAFSLQGVHIDHMAGHG